MYPKPFSFVAFGAVFVTVFVFIFFLFAYDNLITKKSKPTNVAKTIEIYQDQTTGIAKYAYGICQNSSDCAPSGCSGQVCSSDLELVTTCEVGNDFPDKNIYTCGCVENNCVWFK